MFSTPYHLRLKDNQMIVSTKECHDVYKSIPIEDIGIVVLEHLQSTITLPLLNALSENNVAVVLCNGNYMPSAMLMNLDSNKIQAENFEKLKQQKHKNWLDICWQNNQYPNYPYLCLHDIQNSLCEFRKYWRLLNGEKAKKRYFK